MASSISCFELKKDTKEFRLHPWTKIIKPNLAHKIKYAHNSINNPCYPCNSAKKTKQPNNELVRFTVIGNRIAKEFIYCSNIVKGLYKYRRQVFDRPIVHGLNSVEWYDLSNDLKVYYGGPVYCLDGQVAVIVNDKFLGGEQELRAAVKEKYHFHVSLDYQKEAEENFVSYIRCSGRPCVYMHISINDEHIGTLIFMLYAEIVPKTCENFIRLCETRKGGYSGTPVHRIVKDCWIQCGGYGLKSTNLHCENYIVQHDKRGVLGMANDGRHMDCSTQFFVLLQPALWMAYKYTAFGQLIEGEETLRKIESVPTWYESPVSKIVIYRAGIFNVDTPDVTTQNRTKEYLQGHVEDLVKLGELLYEELLKNVFEMIDVEVVVSEESSDREAPEMISDKIGTGTMRTAQRFIRHKNELEEMNHSQSTKSDTMSSGKSVVEELLEQEESIVPVRKAEDHGSLYEENVHYTSIAESLNRRPFVLPLTDVPYPGEVDSVFDLKKFIKGDYCHENDLVTAATGQKKYVRAKVSVVSDASSYKYYSRHSHHQTSDGSLVNKNEIEMKKHLRLKGEHISFAGSVIKNIARASWAHSKHNLFENIRKSDMIGGDESKHSKRGSWPTGEEQISCVCDPYSSCLRDDSFSSSVERPSPFAHLYQDSMDFAATFKNQTLKEAKDTGTSHMRRNPQLPAGDRPIRSSIRITCLDQVLDLQHGKAVAHKISSDYVKTIDQIENEMDENTVGFTEVKRYRPTLTVVEYQTKNLGTKALDAD